MPVLPRTGIFAVSALVITFGSWFGFTKYAENIAFADVKQQLEKLRTVRYVSTRLTEQASDDIEELREMERKGTKPDPKRVFHVSGNGHQPRIVKVMGRYLQRTEILDAMGVIESIQISDQKRGKHVNLTLKNKQFTEFTTQVTMEIDSNRKTEETIKPSLEVDLFAQISEIPANATTLLPERIMGGKKVIGFFAQQSRPTKLGTETWERTYWVDPKTKLPVRIDISYYGSGERIGRSDWINSGFVFDEPIPEEEFSTEPPEGYTRETAKIMGIKID